MQAQIVEFHDFETQKKKRKRKEILGRSHSTEGKAVAMDAADTDSIPNISHMVPEHHQE